MTVLNTNINKLPALVIKLRSGGGEDLSTELELLFLRKKLGAPVSSDWELFLSLLSSFFEIFLWSRELETERERFRTVWREAG